MARTAVVIGGGIAGCSTLYHLTREGWTDVVLVERDELTSGTTWHSAAQVTNFGMNQTMVGLKTHSINLYKDLAEDPDYPITYHHADGGIGARRTSDPKFSLRLEDCKSQDLPHRFGLNSFAMCAAQDIDKFIAPVNGTLHLARRSSAGYQRNDRPEVSPHDVGGGQSVLPAERPVGQPTNEKRLTPEAEKLPLDGQAFVSSARFGRHAAS